MDGRFLILGGGGAWIEMAGQYPIDSEVALRFKLPRRATEFACRAVVRNRMHRRGAGVEFVDITADDRASVIAFIARQTGLPALLLGHIRPVCSLVAPCQPGAALQKLCQGICETRH